MKTYIGIDNGVTGSIAAINDNGTDFYKTPVFLQQDYTKKKQNLNRLDSGKFCEILSKYKENAFVLLERPMVNTERFRQSLSAVRCLESTICILELLKIPYQYIDSKEWQRIFFPKGYEKGETKRLSVEVSSRLFPHLTKEIQKQKDGDALLIAEYARRMRL